MAAAGMTPMRRSRSGLVRLRVGRVTEAPAAGLAAGLAEAASRSRGSVIGSPAARWRSAAGRKRQRVAIRARPRGYAPPLRDAGAFYRASVEFPAKQSAP